MLGFSSLANAPLDTTSDVTLQLTQVSSSTSVVVLAYSSIATPTIGVIGLSAISPIPGSSLGVTENTSSSFVVNVGYGNTPILTVGTSTISPGSVSPSYSIVVPGIVIPASVRSPTFGQFLTSINSNFSPGSTTFSQQVGITKVTSISNSGAILPDLLISSTAVNSSWTAISTGVISSVISLGSQAVSSVSGLKYGTPIFEVNSSLSPGTLSVVSSSTCLISGTSTNVSISSIGFTEGEAVPLVGVALTGQTRSPASSTYYVPTSVTVSLSVGQLNRPVAIRGILSLSSPGNVGTQQFGVKNASGVSSAMSISSWYLYFSTYSSMPVLTGNYSVGQFHSGVSLPILGVSSSFSVNTLYPNSNISLTEVSFNSSVYNIRNTKISKVSSVSAISSANNIRGAYLVQCTGLNRTLFSGTTQSSLFSYIPSITLYATIDSPGCSSIIETKGNTASSTLFNSNLTAVSSNSKVSSLNTWGVGSTMINKTEIAYNENILKVSGGSK